MADLVEVVRKTIRERRLFRSGQRVLVAVSGGVDSMVLLHVLRQLSGANQWQLTIAHLNHQLRGASSNADERLVCGTAEALKLPVVIEKADVRRLMKQQKVSLEMAARNARHEFLARTARRLRIRTVALAHHADDQLELFLLRLLRGSGSQGLAGMKWRNSSPADPRVDLVRPLLDVSKQALRDYAAEHKIRFREDATNASIDILRNRIRHQLVPLLKRHYQPALEQVVPRTIEILRAESDFVDRAAAESVRRMRQETKGGFEGLHVAVQRKVVQIQLLELGIIPDFELIEALRNVPGKPVCTNLASAASLEETGCDKAKGVSSPLPSPPGEEREKPSALNRFKGAKHTPFPTRSVTVLRDLAGRIHVHAPTPAAFGRQSITLDLSSPEGMASFDRRRLRWRIRRKVGAQIPKALPGREFFDADRIGQQIVLRHWMPGDRFQPIGMRSSVKIQDFFTNQKIPRQKRHQLVLAATAEGEIFWIEGMRISDRFKLTKRTIRRLQWAWKRF